MLSESHRSLNSQLSDLQALDARIEHLSTVALGVLAAGIGLAALLIERPPTFDVRAFMVAFGLAVGLNLTAAIAFVGGSVGLLRRFEVAIGPSPAALMRQVEKEAATPAGLVASLLAAYGRYERFNKGVLERKHRRQAGRPRRPWRRGGGLFGRPGFYSGESDWLNRK